MEHLLAPDGTVMSQPLSGGTPTTLASGQWGPGSIAIDASRIYWSAGDPSKQWTDADGCICSMPLSGGAVTTLASGQKGIGQIVVDATNVYWTTDGAVMKLPK